MMWRFSAAMRAILARARQLASEQGNGIVSEAHLFLALLELAEDPESPIAILLAVSGVSLDEARLYAQSAVETGPPQPSKTPRVSLSALKALHRAVAESGRDNNLTLEPRHLFIACLMPRRGPHLGEVMRPLGLDAAKLRAHLRGLRRGEGLYPAGNPLNRLTPDGESVIQAAQSAARAGFCGAIGASHLLLGLLSDEKIMALLQSAGCDAEELKQRARALNKNDGEVATAQPKFAPDARRAIEAAAGEAKRAGRLRLDARDLLLGLLPPMKQRHPESEREPVAPLWTPAQAESLRLAPQSATETLAPPRRREVFTSGKLMGFLHIVNVVFSALLGLIWFIFIHWMTTGVYTRIQLKAGETVLVRYTVVFAFVAAFSEGVFSGQAHSLRNIAGIALGVAMGYLWRVVF